jgi:hypothetical protein
MHVTELAEKEKVKISWFISEKNRYTFHVDYTFYMSDYYGREEENLVKLGIVKSVYMMDTMDLEDVVVTNKKCDECGKEWNKLNNTRARMKKFRFNFVNRENLI